MENNENVTTEVKETVQKKKNNTPMLIMLVAVLLIGAGIALVMTGNNNALFGKGKDSGEGTENDPTRTNIPTELTVEKATQLIKAEQEKDPSDIWTLGEVKIVAKGDNQTYLITYEKTIEEGTDVLQTIVTNSAGEWVIEMPGWFEGEKDLESYNFVYENETVEPPVEEPVETPTDEPVETPVEEPVETPVEEPAEEPVETPAEEPVETPAEEPVETPTE